MEKKHFYISNRKTRIPAMLWGKQSENLLIAVHGNLSNKEDTVISMLAQKTIAKGYQVLSFDLPMHGERLDEKYACVPENCVTICLVFMSMQSRCINIYLFACSMGAYLVCVPIINYDIKQSLFPLAYRQHGTHYTQHDGKFPSK
jgi:alpha-beta hydrolase superfamily lysophospholipase